jgi:hypothetical protein
MGNTYQTGGPALPVGPTNPTISGSSTYGPTGSTGSTTWVVPTYSWFSSEKYGPSSDHPGVVNHIMADGSGHSLSTRIDVAIYMFLITRAGADPNEEVEPGN